MIRSLLFAVHFISFHFALLCFALPDCHIPLNSSLTSLMHFVSFSPFPFQTFLFLSLLSRKKTSQNKRLQRHTKPNTHFIPLSSPLFPSFCLSSYFLFLVSPAFTRTHTHTHIYTYIYIYIGHYTYIYCS